MKKILDEADIPRRRTERGDTRDWRRPVHRDVNTRHVDSTRDSSAVVASFRRRRRPSSRYIDDFLCTTPSDARSSASTSHTPYASPRTCPQSTLTSRDRHNVRTKTKSHTTRYGEIRWNIKRELKSRQSANQKTQEVRWESWL